MSAEKTVEITEAEFETLADDGDGGGLAAVVRRLAETADRIGALREDFASFRLPSSESAGERACGGTHNSSSVDIAGADTPACEPSIEGAPDGAGAAPSSLPRRPASEGRRFTVALICANQHGDGFATMGRLLSCAKNVDILLVPVSKAVSKLSEMAVDVAIFTAEAVLCEGFDAAILKAHLSMRATAKGER